jgi:chromosome segregation ATPase
LKVQSSYSGSQVRCKHCEHKFRAYAPELPSPSSSSFDDYAAGPVNLSESPIERMPVACPVCSATLNVRRAYAGKYVQCKKCNHKFLVPNIIEPRVRAQPASAEPDLFDRLYQELDPAEEVPPEPVPGPDPSAPSAELVAIRGERDRLHDSVEALKSELARTESERDSALARLGQLQEQHESLGSQQDQSATEQQKLVAELASMREELGGSTPRELLDLKAAGERLAAENEQQAAENERLQAEVKTLQAEVSARADLAQTLQQRDDELSQSRQTIQQLEEQLRGQVSQQDRLAQEARGLLQEIEASEALAKRLNREIEQHDLAVKTAEDRVGELVQKLRGLEGEQAASRTEIERLAALHQSARDEAEQHRAALSQRELELGRAGQERAAEIDSLRAILAQAEQAQRDERGRLEEEVHRAAEETAARTSERAELESRVRQLLDAQESLKANHATSLESHQTRISGEFQTRLDEEQSRHAQQVSELRAQLAESVELTEVLKQDLRRERAEYLEHIAGLQSRTSEDAQLIERLKSEIVTLAHTRATPDADLEAAQQEIAELRRQLSETETSKRSMSSMLEGMGIRLH